MINDLKPSRVAFAGDWHMNGSWSRKAIAYAAEQGAEVIVHTGDFGYTFDQDYLIGLTTSLQRHDLKLYFVDGNHDDHELLASLPAAGDGTRKAADGVYHLPRGFRWRWGDVRFLALGGAHSVDRQHRTPGVSWWPGELISTKDANWATNGYPVDVMVTHDCPTGVEIPGSTKTTLFYPEEEIRSSEGNREILASVVDEMMPNFLFHGHYHQYYTEIRHICYSGAGTTSLEKWHDTLIVGLDRDEMRMEHNIFVTDLSELRGKP